MSAILSGKSFLFIKAIILSLLLIIVSSCSVKLISSYDEITDKTVTQLQKDFETFFITIECLDKPNCEYENHKRFYQDAKITISSLAIRANAIPKNSLTIKQIEILKNSLDNLEKLHKLGCLSVDQIKDLRNSFNVIFTAILKLEIAKKRGKNNSE